MSAQNSYIGSPNPMSQNVNMAFKEVIKQNEIVRADPNPT